MRKTATPNYTECQAMVGALYKAIYCVYVGDGGAAQ